MTGGSLKAPGLGDGLPGPCEANWLCFAGNRKLQACDSSSSWLCLYAGLPTDYRLPTTGYRLLASFRTRSLPPGAPFQWLRAAQRQSNLDGGTSYGGFALDEP